MGFFSWQTQDTGRSISNKFSDRGTFTVYMVNPKTDEVYKEDNYEGYGVFGGKSFNDLLCEMNPDTYGSDMIFPVLVEHLENAKKYYGKRPNTCEFQGYFY